MKKFYLIGNNLENSLSPYIHNYIFKLLQIEAKYEIKKLHSKDQLYPLILDISKGDIEGINITNPYKIEALNYLDSCDKVAQKIGAINCIAREDSQSKGFNTDWYGFKRMLGNRDINHAKIIGYGGAGKAVEYALLLLGVTNIQIYTRKKINHYNNIIYKNINEIISNKNKKIQNSTFIINATPNHFINEMSLDNFSILLSEKLFWIDLLYTKLSTEKEKYLERKLYKNGLDMLIYQAFESIKIWFRKDITKDVDFNDLKSYLEGLNNAI